MQKKGAPEGIRMNQRAKTGLSQNQIKMIAVVAMVLDHVGIELFPQLTILRIIGRLAFPVFSYCICEGSRRTHHPMRYLARLLCMGLLCMVGYYVYTGIIYGNILITFSLSLCALYAFSYLQTGWAQNKTTVRLAGMGVMLGCIVGIWLLCSWITIDYGFFGVMLPLFAELVASIWDKCSAAEVGRSTVRLIGFSVGLLVLSLQMGGIQIFSLLTIPLLFAYNGSRGERNLKQFFYWFYPVHLMLIGLVSMWI